MFYMLSYNKTVFVTVLLTLSCLLVQYEPLKAISFVASAALLLYRKKKISWSIIVQCHLKVLYYTHTS